MSKKVIAVDIDDVLAVNVPAFIKYSNENWGTNLTLAHYDEHWVELWKVDQEEAERRASQFHGSGIFSTYEHFSDAKEVLLKLSQKFKLVIITSRRLQLEKETLAWVDKYFKGIFKGVHFAGLWDTQADDRHTLTKAEICRQVGADFLIDDQPKHCLAAADAGIQALLFGDYSWNRQVRPHSNLTRVHDWADVAEYFGV